MNINEQTLKNIYFLGKYYNPASSHYNLQNSVVTCDRCHRTNIPVAIGWETYDLCLSCADDMSKLFSKPIYYSDGIKTMMLQSMFDPSKKAPPPPSVYSEKPKYLTKMLQKQYREKSCDSDMDCLTFMEQAQFTTNMEQMQFRKQ